MDIYEKVNNEIIQRLEEAEKNGTEFHWISPYNIGKPYMSMSYKSQQTYHGINCVILSEPNEYLTFNMINDINKEDYDFWHIRKGAKGKPVLYYKEVEDVDKDTGEILLDKYGNIKKKKILKHYTVYSREDVVNQEGDNLPSKLHFEHYNHDDIVKELRNKLNEFNSLFNEYTKMKNINVEKTTDGTIAYYSIDDNTIRVPKMENFSSVYDYIHTCSHELIHSTMLAMNRKIPENKYTIKFNREELVAEIGADLMCARLRIFNDSMEENSLAYLQSWASYLKKQNKEIITASKNAEKAVKYILENVKILNREFYDEER